MQVINGFGLKFGLTEKILGSYAAPNPIGANHNQRIEGHKIGFAGADVVEWHIDTPKVELVKLPFVAHVDDQRTGLLPEHFHLIQVNIGVGRWLQKSGRKAGCVGFPTVITMQ